MVKRIVIDEDEGSDEFSISDILKLLKEIKQLQQTAGSLTPAPSPAPVIKPTPNRQGGKINEDKLNATIDSLLNELEGNELLAKMSFKDVLKLAKANKEQLKEKIKQIVEYITS